MNHSIDQEVEDKLQGDAALHKMPLADQRVLNMSNPNYYFIRKQDFNSPHIYNLNIMKPFGRSKIRTFVSNDLCTNDKQR